MDTDQARQVARETVRETFLALGVDVSDPESMIGVQADFAFLRRQRLAGESLKAHLVRLVFSVLGLAIFGFATWAIAALQHAGKLPPGGH